MKKRVNQVDGEVNIGSIVHVVQKNVDRTKVDSANITGVVVEGIKSRGEAPPEYRLVCENRQQKNLYAKRYIQPVPNATPALMGLQEVYTSWQGLSKILEREAARSTSIVDGQGMIKCDCITKCTTKCTTKRYKCKKANRYCIYRCHKGDQKCCNYDHS